ncbi:MULTISPECIES: OadG family protein [Tissierellales]|nr:MULTISPECIES: OadG family protein [Tissierellales]
MSEGLRLLLYGMITTFFILIVFYFLIKLLNKIFPEK